MRKLVVVEMLSIDGVMQGPGGPDEDRGGGFEHGGWAMRYGDQVFFDAAARGMADTDAQLFGRRTYEIMAAYWPNAPADDMFAKHLNGVRKYVVSRSLSEPLEWDNSTLLQGDSATAVAELKRQPGKNISVLGSGELVQTLIANDLVDEYSLMIAPIVLGSGVRLFREYDDVRPLELVDAITTTTGAQLLTYRPQR
jgi:dihydrofolate reductase